MLVVDEKVVDGSKEGTPASLNTSGTWGRRSAVLRRAGPGWDVWPMGGRDLLAAHADDGLERHLGARHYRLTRASLHFFPEKNVVTGAQSRENILMQHIFSHFLIFLYLSLCPYILYLCLQSIVCFCYRWTWPWRAKFEMLIHILTAV